MKCCGKEVTTSFCPECGHPTGSVNALLRHLKQRAEQSRLEYVRKQARIGRGEEEGWPDRNVERAKRSAERVERTYAKWRGWAEWVEVAMTASSASEAHGDEGPEG